MFEFGEASGRAVVAGFDGGAITSDTGLLLLGEVNRDQAKLSRTG
jgi:hypothetical protein